MSRNYYIYIMTNPIHTVLYTGMTNDLLKRAGEHKEKNIEGFSCKYNCIELVYFEIFTKPIEAIQREKQIKAGSRNKKIELIEQKNPKWRDLYYDLL